MILLDCDSSASPATFPPWVGGETSNQRLAQELYKTVLFDLVTREILVNLDNIRQLFAASSCHQVIGTGH